MNLRFTTVLLFLTSSWLGGIPPLQAQSGCGEGTTISLLNGDTSALQCIENGSVSALTFTTGPTYMPYVYLVTDEDNIILKVNRRRTIDLSDLGAGNFRVWALYYKGPLFAQPGMNAAEDELAAYCFGLTENFVPVGSFTPDAGTIESSAGNQVEFLCDEDPESNSLTFELDSNAPNLQLLVTDTNDIILDIPTGFSIDFNEQPNAIYRVWGLSFAGDLTAEVGQNITEATLAEECFDLSDNFVSVLKAAVDGGSLSLVEGQEDFACNGETSSFSFEQPTSSSLPYGYVLVGPEGTILEVTTEAVITIDTPAGTGAYQVFGLSFSGMLNDVTGQLPEEAQFTDACFELSDEAVDIRIRTVEGGTISLAEGGDSLLLCVEDTLDTAIELSTTAKADQNYAYFVLDTNNTILAVFETSQVILPGSFSGRLEIAGLGYTGNLMVEAGDAFLQGGSLSDECFEVAENRIQVQKLPAEGGTISANEGQTDLLECFTPGMQESLIQLQRQGDMGAAYAYLLTDTSGTILQVLETEALPIDRNLPQQLTLTGLAYTGTLLAEPGQNINDAPLAEPCSDLSENTISIQWEAVDGGTVSLENGDTAVRVCVMDEVTDLLVFANTSTETADFRYVLTDTAGIVRFVLAGDRLDYDPAEAGPTRVYGVSFTGTLLLSTGDDIQRDAVSNGCYDLSSNFVRLLAEEVDGGRIAFTGEPDTVAICPEGQTDVLSFTTTGMAPYAYLITDTANIIEVVTADTAFDFDQLANDQLRVWGLSYTGELLAEPGQDAAIDSLSTACFELSENFLSVTRSLPEGGNLAFAEGGTDTLICSDAEFTLLTFSVEGATAGAYALLVLDTQNLVLDLTIENVYDFENLVEGQYAIQGLSYTGALTITPGDTLGGQPLSDDCFDLSANTLLIRKQQPAGGTISFKNSPDSLRYTCPDDGIANALSFQLNGSVGDQFAYLLTDLNNMVVAVSEVDSLDLEPFLPGDYLIYGMAYTGELLAAEGAVVGQDDLATGCFSTSSNFLQTFHEEPEAGTIRVLESVDTSFCIGDGNNDVLTFEREGPTAGALLYLVTDDSNRLQVVFDRDSFDFEELAGGNARVYSLAYTGEPTLEIGEDVTQVPLSDECHDLSDNFIDLFRESIDGAQISAQGSPYDTLWACPDGNPDIFVFTNSTTATEAAYAYVITNRNGIILAILEDDSLNFDNINFPELKVHGFSYTGALTAQAGQFIEGVIFSNGCYQQSENHLTVIRDTSEGGAIAKLDEAMEAFQFCPGRDGSTLELVSTSGSRAGYVYVLVDSANTIQHITPPGVDQIVLDTFPLGDYTVWGLSFTGFLNINAGAVLDTSAALSNNCFEFSDNSLAIELGGEVEAGRIESRDSVDIYYTCPMDEEPDFVSIRTPMGPEGTGYRLVITDEKNDILFTDVESNTINFDNSERGIFRIWGINFRGAFNIMGGLNLFEDQLLPGCYDISDNFIPVHSSRPEGGSVSLLDGSTEIELPANPTENSILEWLSTADSIAGLVFLITDKENVIIDTTSQAVYDFNGLDDGAYRVLALSYTGFLLFGIGDDVDETLLTDNCFDLSDNFISVLIGGTEGIAELPQSIASKRSQISLSPNPVRDELQLIYNGKSLLPGQAASVQLVDLSTGQLVKERPWEVQQGASLILGLADLPAGMYVLRLQAGEQILQQKFVKLTE